MNLSELCIRRPVFASVLSLVVVLVGLMGYSRLPVREYPNIDEPVVSVTTEYRGASPEIIESQVTQPLEEVLSGIEGVDLIVSQSREGRSQISVRFRIDRDQDSAAADVRDRVSRARRQLPEEVDEPVIAKVEADAQPIIYLALSSDRQSPGRGDRLSPTASSRTACRTCPVSPRSGSSARACRRCASGSTGCASPPTA